MKQTPIPEKIKIQGIAYNLTDKNTILLANRFNSLIDVLTEQQKDIKELKESNAKQPPYTAMRSTGEYCECKQPDDNWETHYCDRCQKKMRSDKPIKPQSGAAGEPPYGVYPIKSQEDVTRIIKDNNTIKSEIVSLLFKGNFCQSESMAEDITDRILAIVKGE